MIIVDYRTGSKELEPELAKLGVPTHLDTLAFGDFAWEGYGRSGACMLGVERKTLSDLITCMTDARYADLQLPGMLKLYKAETYLLFEAIYRSDEDGKIQHWGWDYVRRKQGWVDFGFKTRTGKTVRPYTFDQLEGFLWTIQRVAGVKLIRTRTKEESARALRNLWKHSQKPNEEHHSLHKFCTGESITDTFRQEPDLMQYIASRFPGVGWKKAGNLAQHFDTISEMILASREKLQEVDGIGKGLADAIYMAVRKRRK
jgi:ERCC4-type nuclease